MSKIVRSYVLIISAILCLTLLVTGIIGVNEETSFVISGKREDVLKVQSTTSEQLLVKSGEEDKHLMSFDFDDLETAFILLSGVLPSPFSDIIWAAK